MDFLRRFIKFWFPAVIYAILIFWFSSMEKPLGIEFGSGITDKLLHVLEYAVFGILLMRALYCSDSSMSWRITILIAFMIGAFYGFTDELHQSVVPGRYATAADFVADIIGVLAGIWLYRFFIMHLKPGARAAGDKR